MLVGGMKKPQDDEQLRGFDDYSVRLGDEMRGIRATMGKSLLDVERDLNIRAVLINAIEQADLDSFETKWVIPGHVRTYSKYLGMDPEDGYRRFCMESGFVAKPGSVLNSSRRKKSGGGGFSGISLRRTRRSAPKRAAAPAAAALTPAFDRRILQTLLSSALVCGLTAGIGYVGWTAYDAINSVRLAGVSERLVAGAEVENYLPAASAGERAPGKGIALTGADTAYRRAKTMGEIRPGEFGVYAGLREPLAPVITVDPDLVAAAGTDVDDPDAVAAADPDVMDESSEQQAAAVIGTVDPQQVVLVPSRPAWVRVSKTDGTVIKEETLSAGSEFEVPRNAGPLRLRAGNSGSLYFIVGGEVYGPAGTGTSVAKNVDLEADEIRIRFERVAADQVPKEIVNVGWNSQSSN